MRTVSLVLVLTTLVLRYVTACAAREGQLTKEVPGAPTGEGRLQYELCSSSASARIAGCEDADWDCACEGAVEGFGCITSHAPSHTPALCSASALLSSLCAAPAALPADVACPTTAGYTAHAPHGSEVESTVAMAGTTRTLEGGDEAPSMAVPSLTGEGGVGESRVKWRKRGEGKGEGGGVRVFLAVGIGGSVVLAGVAAYW